MSFGNTRVPLYVLNVTYPLIDAELTRFCEAKRAILVIEEGQPEFIEQGIATILRRADIQTRIEGKSMLPMAGEYTGGVVRDGVRRFIETYRPDLVEGAAAAGNGLDKARLAKAAGAVAPHVHTRPPSFCTGCPERPIFAAMKLVERELGAHHVSCDIGCHLFSILPPFNIGNTTMGYGLGGAGAAALNAKADKRAIAVIGDGGFWHNGLVSIDRQCRLQPQRQRPHHRRQRLLGRDRRPGPPLVAPPTTTSARPGTRSRRRCAASASAGCARCATPTTSPRCATR